MKEVRVWASDRPLTFAILLLLVVAIYFVAPVFFVDVSQLFGHGKQQQGASDFAQNLLAEMLLAGVLVGIVVFIGWARETGLTTIPRWRATLFAVPYVMLILFMVLYVYGTVLLQNDDFALSAADWRAVQIASFAAFIVGIFEELLFRGVVLHGLRAKMAAIPAVMVAALIFGAFHFVNWVGGQPLDVTFSQVAGAAGGGVFYGALVLWTGSLWPSILMHGLWDSGITLIQTTLITRDGLTETNESSPDFAPSDFAIVDALLSPEMIYGLILLGLWGWQNHRRSTV